MSSSAQQAYRTQAMPAFMSVPGTPSVAPLHSVNFSLHDIPIDALSLAQRRLSSLGCSSTSSSSSSSWHGSRFRRRLPFASIAGEQAGSIGQLRWLSNSSSSAQQPAAADAKPSNQQQQNLPFKLDPEAYAAAAKAATAPDVFKQGDVLGGGKYKLIAKLGTGKYGAAEGVGEGRFTTLWRGKDMSTGQEVVLKLVEAGDGVSYVAGTREAALHALAGSHPHILGLRDAFEHRSSQGRHACMVLDKAGSDLCVVSNLWGARGLGSKGGWKMACSQEGLAALRTIARQTLLALDHLHKRGIVHMDLEPGNVLLDKPFRPMGLVGMFALFGEGWSWKRVANAFRLLRVVSGSKESLVTMQKELDASLPDIERTLYHEGNLSQASIKLTDFGRAVPYKALTAPGGSLGLQYNRDGIVVMGDPGLRPPEEVLGMDYTAPPYDIWRLGCMVYELAAGDELFHTRLWNKLREKHPRLHKYSDDAMHLMDMQASLGNMHRELICRAPEAVRDLFFLPNYMLRVSNTIEWTPGSTTIYACLMNATRFAADREEIHKLAEFVEATLVYDPSLRPTAEQLLKHRWLQES